MRSRWAPRYPRNMQQQDLIRVLHRRARGKVVWKVPTWVGARKPSAVLYSLDAIPESRLRRLEGYIAWPRVKKVATWVPMLAVPLTPLALGHGSPTHEEQPLLYAVVRLVLIIQYLRGRAPSSCMLSARQAICRALGFRSALRCADPGPSRLIAHTRTHQGGRASSSNASTMTEAMSDAEVLLGDH